MHLILSYEDVNFQEHINIKVQSNIPIVNLNRTRGEINKCIYAVHFYITIHL